MKRSGGVTVVAILSLLGSLLTFALGIVMLAVMTFATKTPDLNQPPALPTPLKFILAMSALVYLLPAIWGIVTSIGLWRLRNWARISIIVFSVILIMMGGFAGLMTLVVPFPAVPNSNVNPSMLGGIRFVMGAFWLTLMGIGVWWLVFFNRSNVKKQFGQTSPMLIDGSHPLTSADHVDPKRPLSITILAWFLLAGCLFSLPILMIRPLAILLTKVLTGWPAILFYLLFGAAQLCIGIGLLRLRPVARTAGMIYFVFFFANTAVFYFWPGAHSRFPALMQSERSMFPWMRMLPNQPEFQYDTTRFLVFGGFVALVGVAVPLYFLVTRRFAFEDDAASLASGSS
jgi:hypothetical protein